MKAITILFAFGFFALLFGCTENENSASSQAASSPPAATSANEATAIPSDPPDQTQAAPLPASGTGLKILQFIPNGPASKLSQVVVMFNQPMVALGDYEQVDQSLMSLTPKLEGKLRWLNQYCLAFIPDQPILGSLTLKATLKAGIKSLSGDSLTEEHSVDVSLPDLEVVYANEGRPLITYENPLRPVWTVYFNQSPDLESLKKLAFFQDQGQETNDFKISVDVEQIDKEVVFSGPTEFKIWPTADLPIDTLYSLIIQPGLISTAGPKPMAEPLNAFTGKTYGRLVASLSGPQQQDSGEFFQEYPDNYLEINFNNPVSLVEALPFIEVEPKIPHLDQLKKQYSKDPKKTSLPEDELSTGADLSTTDISDQEDLNNSGEQSVDNQNSSIDSAEVTELAAEETDVPDYVTSIPLYASLKANTKYTIIIKSGLKDGFNQTTTEDQVLSFFTGSYQPQVYIPQDSGILERKTNPVIPIEVVNTKSFQVQGYALTQSQAIQLLVNSQANFSYGYISEAAKGLNYLSQIGNPKVMEFRPPNQAVDGPIAMGVNLEELFGPDRLGHFLVLHIPNAQNKTFSMFQISDLGLTVKVGRNSGLAWTTDLTTGRSLEGVEVEILSVMGNSLWQGKSGPEGLVELPGGQDLIKIIQDKGLNVQNEIGNNYHSLFVVARDNDQMTLWNLAWTLGFDSYTLGLNSTQWPLETNTQHGFLLTSQPIYKPGETVQLKVIAREAFGDDLVDLPKGKVKLVVADSYLNVVSEIVTEMSSLGTASADYPIPANGKLGTYQVFMSKDPEAAVGPDSNYPYVYSNPNLTNYGYFTVENFRAPAFDIKFENLPKEVFSGDQIEIQTEALYHFGGPVANRPAEYSFTSEDLLYCSTPTLPGFSLVNSMSPIIGDEIGDEDMYTPVLTLLSGTGTLDDNGRLNFTLNLDKSPKPRPRQLTVHMGAQDVDGRSVFKTVSILAHPASIYPALKTRTIVAQAGEPSIFDYAAAKPDGTLVKSDLKITLYQRSWNTVRRRSPGGVYMYTSKPYDELIQEISVSSEENKSSVFELTPPKAGYYWVKASLKDEKGRENESSVTFYAAGDNPVGWRYFNDDTLTMIPDKSEYAPGDTAKILVQSPFSEAEALVTVERAGIRQSSVVEVKSQSPVFEIPIAEDDGPNVFVSIILSRGRIAEQPDKNNVDLGKPTIKKGYLTLKIPTKADILQVDLNTDSDTYTPGSEVKVDLKVLAANGQNPGETEIALAVVDTALIQLVGDDVYFPEKRFSADRPLAIATINPIISLIGRRNLTLKGSVEAGGGAMDSMAQAAAPAQEENLRQLFKNTAFFKPDIPVSADGTASVSFTLPDNLTTFKLYAVATGHGRLSGTGKGEILVTKDILLRSSLPEYASIGDEFTAAVTVTNRTDKPGRGKVSLSANNIEFKDSISEQEIELAPKQSLEVGFKVKAASLGQADFTFNVSMGSDSDSALYRLPILPLNALTTQATYLQLAPGSTKVDLALPAGYDPNRGDLSLELTPGLVGVLTGSFKYLEVYPHNCLEQLTSKAYGSLFSIILQKRLNLKPDQIEEAKAKVEDHINLLKQLNLGGGYNLWASSTDWGNRHPYLTAFILEFLLDAQEADFKVDNNLINEICNYLRNYLNDPVAYSKTWHNESDFNSIGAYIVMVLAKAGQEVSSNVEVIFNKKDKLPIGDIINLVRTIGYQPRTTGRTLMLRDSIIALQNSFSITAGQTQISTIRPNPWTWTDDDKLTATALLALMETAPHNEFIPGLIRNLILRLNKGYYSSTQSNIYALNAFSKYINYFEDELPNLTITALLKDKELVKTTFTSPINPPVLANEDLKNLSGVNSLDLNSEGKGQAWAGVKLSTAKLDPDLSADLSSGLILSRSYEVIRPKCASPSQTTFQRGQVVKVTVTMMTPNNRQDLVLEDKIPAGFETINLNFLSEDQTLVPQPDPANNGWKYSDSFWFNHQEVWPDRVSVYTDYLPAGVYTFSYLVRPITVGNYHVPGPRAEEMYSPEIYGRGQGQTLTVTADVAK